MGSHPLPGQLHRRQSTSPPKLRYGSKARVMSPLHAGSTIRKAHCPNDTCGTHATTSLADRGDTTSTPRGRWQERPRAVLMAEYGRGLSTCLPTPPEALPKDDAMSPPLTPPSSSRDAPPGVAIQGTKESIKASKKRHKQHRQEATTDNDDDINEQAGGASAEHTVEATGSNKRQA
jgi:hypothetical protein